MDIFDKLKLLDSSHLYDVSKHEELNNTVSDTKDEVEFMISEINDAIKYIAEAAPSADAKSNE